jgi:hypothetical protein
MNLRLGEQRIRMTCRELLTGGDPVSGRALRRALRTRFGAVGKTARVFQIWREESAPPVSTSAAAESPDIADVQHRLHAAEAAAAENLARAERAEFREQSHQDHWALEIDRLREQLRAQPKYAMEIRALQEQVLRLSAELQVARALLSQTQ